MRTFKICVLAIFLFLSALGFANDIKVKNASFDSASQLVSFDLSWKNSWHNSKNFDAAWVFVKFIDADGSYIHANLELKSHNITGNTKAKVEVSNDQIGAFIYSTEPHRGNVNWHVKLKLDSALIKNLPTGFQVEVFAIEMVYIPKGSFYIGAIEKEAIDYASFYESDMNGNPVKPYLISSEDQMISVSPTAGNLYYQTEDSPYRGDSKGEVPSTFPKGYAAFYIMKYETTQGVYSDFLNAIKSELALNLSPHTVEDYYKKKGGIRLVDSHFVADTYNRPANFITWDDGAVFADWAGLRPMTELEFTKAARGSSEPFVHEFPWGTDNTKDLKRQVALSDELIFSDAIKEKDLNDKNRHIYGASYYWVMDLAGSLWEKCVTIGDPIGRQYFGSHGDGIITNSGASTNSDWPKGIKEEGGYGYRGGGYYNHGMKISDFNPHSPIAYRPYGSWAGGKRSIAYSQRYVRTANN